MELEKGTLYLIEDLEELLAEAKAGEFGDFTNTKYAAPKMVLVNKLIDLVENTKQGKYD